VPRLDPIALTAAMATCLLVVPPVAAQDVDPRRQLQDIERDLEAGRQRQQEREQESARLQQETRDLQTQLVAAAAKVRDAEAQASDGEARLAELRTQRYALRAELGDRRSELSTSLSALVRLQRQPDIVLLANGGPSIDTLRAARLLASTSRHLDAEAQAIATSLDRLRRIEDGIAEEQSTLAATVRDLDAGREDLRRLLAEKQARQSRLAAENTAERQRLEVLTTKAKDLKSLLEQLARADAERQAAEAQRAAEGADTGSGLARLTGPATPAPQASFSKARGRLSLPAVGTIVAEYGEDTGFGSHTRGTTLMTRDEAQVVAPFDGEIVFAGPFRGYGVVLIIAHSEGYHTLLAGMARTYVAAGQAVLAGEPIGQMGRGDGENRSLYVELRRRGEAFDPRTWWADNRRKVSG